jgi:hypothetical protein
MRLSIMLPVSVAQKERTQDRTEVNTTPHTHTTTPRPQQHHTVPTNPTYPPT